MIEIIAMLSMLIDHIGVVFFPDDPFFRILGRLAFPLYAWGIVQGYFYTRNIKNYQKRLLWLAVLSQIPFMFLSLFRLNVIFTFLLCILILKILDSDYREKYSLIIIIALFTQFFSDYGAYAILLVLIFKFFKGYSILAAHLCLDLFYLVMFGWWLQPFSVIATLIILNRDKLKKIKVNRLFYRSFYPAHLALLVLIQLFFKGGL
ncbi:MAG TPA: conjugal transfer protein TraX [Bacillus bacterium]|nr:conjugal transfer protein TraX [Bacillus sp. (in: firmicutes)]